METLLVDAAVAKTALPAVCSPLHAAKVELRGCKTTCEILPYAVPVADGDYGHEFLDLILAVKVVDGIDGAIAHIEKHSSGHTEAIVTENYTKAQRFLRAVNSSCVLVNASTRFNDGGELGLGAELGISTSRIHAYGPLGLTELTISKFFVLGSGQVRG
jgi:glutamate-5-semialdehyde dehydrogenase